MKRNLTVAIFLIFVLAGCSTDAPLPSTTNPATTAAAQAPAITSGPATSETSAPTGENPATTENPAATTENPAATDGSPPVTASNVSASIDIATAAAATIADTTGYFRFQTLFSEQDGTCLEGNNRMDGAVLQGATFMDTCQNVSGQVWKITPAEQQGYYRLQTRFLESQNKCLEGNQIAPDAVLGGAAFMSDCANVSGQSWKFVDAGEGTYRLQTAFKEGESKCLEGNRVEALAVLQGAAFQDDCKDVTGQVWKLVAVAQADAAAATNREIIDMQSATGAVIANTNVYYHIQRIAGDENRLCLNGNGVADGAAVGGAAFMGACTDDAGQQWHIIPTERQEYYRLQPLSHVTQGTCFEGNQLAPNAMLGGAAFMHACSNETGQIWKFVDAGNSIYFMQTEFLAAENKCLDGNTVADGALLQGGAYMSTCQKTAAQQWVLTPIEGTSTIPEGGEPKIK